MSTRHIPTALFLLAFVASGCTDTQSPSALDTDVEAPAGQAKVQFGPVVPTSNMPKGVAALAPPASIDIAGVGANFGNAEAAEICASGDLTCTFTPVSAAAFNSMTPDQLRTAYDVLIFTWISSSGINADWNTRLVPYMNRGGGVIFEDPANLSDLSPGITASEFNATWLGEVSAFVPGLTDGVTNSFINSHIRFTAWDPALSPFLTNRGDVVGLYGEIGSGCLVATGPDQHFHGSRGAGGAAGNQYNLLLNEVRWVTGISGDICGRITVDVDIKPGTDKNPVNSKSRGVVPVAILGSADFDVTDVDRSTLSFGPAGASPAHDPAGHLEDVDEDGYTDLMTHYRQTATGLAPTDTVACIEGRTRDGTPLVGCDAVGVLGEHKKKNKNKNK